MFEQRLAGCSVAGIARELNERGVPCPSDVDPQRNRHVPTGWRRHVLTSGKEEDLVGHAQLDRRLNTCPPRRFVDENSLGVAKALAYVRGDITWPGAAGGSVPAVAADTAWLPIVGQAGLVVLTGDKRIRSRPLERQALLDHGVRLLPHQRRQPRPVLPAPAVAAVLDDIEALVAEQPAPWLASVTRTGVRTFDTR